MESLFLSIADALFQSIWIISLVGLVVIAIMKGISIKAKHLYKIISISIFLIVLVFLVQVISNYKDYNSTYITELSTKDIYRASSNGKFVQIHESSSKKIIPWDSIGLNVSTSICFWLILLWISIVSYLLLRLGHHYRVLIHSNKYRRLDDLVWVAALAEIKEKLNYTSEIKLLATNSYHQPFTYGSAQASIVVPESLITVFNHQEIKALLTHEVAHIKRRDFTANFLMQISCALLFFHPLIWWLRDQANIVRELSCDDLVLKFEVDSETYSRALLLINRNMNNTTTNVLGLGALSDTSGFLVRIKRIFRQESWRLKLKTRVVVLIAMTIPCSLISLNIQRKLPDQKVLISMPDSSYPQTNQSYRLYNVSLNLFIGAQMNLGEDQFKYVINDEVIDDTSTLSYYKNDFKVDSLLYMANPNFKNTPNEHKGIYTIYSPSIE